MNSKKVSDSILTLIVIFVISLVLNYLWESLHEAFLYEVFKCKADHYILMILEASVIDASIIVGMYLGVAAVWRDMLWFLIMKRSQVLAALTAGLLIAIYIEYRSAIVLKAWSYLPSMPTIFGIGLSPLIQLSTTGLLAYWLARRFLFQRCSCE